MSTAVSLRCLNFFVKLNQNTYSPLKKFYKGITARLKSDYLDITYFDNYHSLGIIR